MAAVKPGLAAVATVVTTGALAAYFSRRRAMTEAEEGWRSIAARARPPERLFDAAGIASLPEVARRYFTHAIAPGTPLRTIVALNMRGRFLLGTRNKYQTYRMTARQILAPPDEFVWISRMRSGLMRISGSDALVGGSAWTRFWLNGLVPVASESGSADLRRSAEFRSAMEGIWAPASLLPENGAMWEQISANRARVTVGATHSPIVFEMTVNQDGALREISGLRWSNANAGKTFRLQPFGGTVTAEAGFDGYTIPGMISVGNHFGTDDYLPFFQAEITDASFL